MKGRQVEIDWKGIARSGRAISQGQGQNIVVLITDTPVDEQRLNALIPDEDGEFPANGTWFAGPQGWMLFIEHESVPVSPRLEELARNLDRAGIHGTLTGAKTFSAPAWARKIWNLPRWRASLSYRQLPEYGPYPGAGWSCDPVLLGHLLDHLLGWAAMGDGQLTVAIRLRADFPFDAPAAKRVFRDQVDTEYVSSATAYNKSANQLRSVTVANEGSATMSLIAHEDSWVPIIDDLRAALRAAPLEGLNIALLDHHDWDTFTGAPHPTYDFRVYRSHPELWDEYTPAPCGIQILTDKHLTRAHNLDDWNTTRLNERLHLVQAKDLGPWYSQPLSHYEQPDPEVITKARLDFGDMLFTHATAERLNLSIKR